MNTLTILQGDCRAMLKTLPEKSVNCCVTSPPYFGLRDYGTATWEGGDAECNHAPRAQVTTSKTASNSGALRDKPSRTCGCGATRIDSQIGLEETPRAYVDAMVLVFSEVWRVLRDDGTVWLNIADSYASGGRGALLGPKKAPAGYKNKDLLGIPWMLAFALRDAGWYLRSDIIWAKPNPMPESVTDRPTKSHEHIFLLSKQEKYYYDADAIAEPASDAMYQQVEEGYDGLGLKDYESNGVQNPSSVKARIIANARNNFRRDTKEADVPGHSVKQHRMERPDTLVKLTVNKRDVWRVPTASFKEAHFATFPPALITPCILAGCPKDGTVLDPFLGSGTTAMVALQCARNAIGIELNPEYAAMAKKRCDQFGYSLGI